jgi:hypothetical protein
MKLAPVHDRNRSVGLAVGIKSVKATMATLLGALGTGGNMWRRALRPMWFR